jgi:hypothetical protein
VEDQSALSESVVLCPVPNTIPLANWVCLIGQIGPESGDPEGILLKLAIMGGPPCKVCRIA